jgi:transaldolase
VLELAAKHPLTDKGIENFLKDWQKFTDETGGKLA